MRLTKSEINVIKNAVADLDCHAQVWLFGSRTDDSKLGGDIDLLILSNKLGFADQLRIKAKLFEHLDEQKVDIVIVSDFTKPLPRLALESGIKL